MFKGGNRVESNSFSWQIIPERGSSWKKRVEELRGVTLIRKRVIRSATVVKGTTLKWSFRKVSEIVDDFEQMAHSSMGSPLG